MTLPLHKLFSIRRLIDEFAAHIVSCEQRDCLAADAADRVDRILNSQGSIERSPSTLESLIEGKMQFGSIYADPPWPYDNVASRGAAENHYRTMSLRDIAELPISQLAAKDAHLHLWTTNAFLFEAHRVIEAWGFTYKSCLVWIKPQMGNGNYWRVSHEFLLLGVRGDAVFSDKTQQSWLYVDRTKHSSKPAIFRKLIEQVSPGPRLELFARGKAPGWMCWGNQVEPDLFSTLDDQ